MHQPLHIAGVELYFLPVRTRTPLKFGLETVTAVTCARASIAVRDEHNRSVTGWGETPLSVQWAWPGALPIEPRHQAMKDFCGALAARWAALNRASHPIETGHDFLEEQLPALWRDFNARHQARVGGPMPWLAALVCASVFDQAYHDAYGRMLDRPVYETYRSEFMRRDLSAFLSPAPDTGVSFQNRFPNEFLSPAPRQRLPAGCAGSGARGRSRRTA